MSTEAKSQPFAGPSEKRLLTPDEVADHIGMSTKWVYAETRRDRIPHIKLGRRYRYREAAIDRWLVQIESGPARLLERAQEGGASDVNAAAA